MPGGGPLDISSYPLPEVSINGANWTQLKRIHDLPLDDKLMYVVKMLPHIHFTHTRVMQLVKKVGTIASEQSKLIESVEKLGLSVADLSDGVAQMRRILENGVGSLPVAEEVDDNVADFPFSSITDAREYFTENNPIFMKARGRLTLK